jgi:hypothetical protein
MFDRERYVLPALLVLAASVFLTGIGWGLPSRAVNPYLFGNHNVWSGAEVLALAGPTEDPDRSVDVASHAAIDRSVPVVVNNTDVDRARIVRRYRLMSYQPDEWSTLKSLSEMKPGRWNFDPKLYQYGGLWIYPIGAMLKVGSLLHLIELREDVTWYLDNPEAFGRFYIVARLWSVAWALAGVVAVFVVVRRIVRGWRWPAVAAIGFMLMPVVINCAHEGKPHLAGAVLTLLAVIAASNFVERGTVRTSVLSGVLCGAAAGMIVSTLPVFLILPAMVLLRRLSWGRRAVVCIQSTAVGVLVYFLTNPYVPYDWLFHRSAMISNLRNFQSVYHFQISLAGIGNAIYLTAISASPVVALMGGLGMISLAWRAIQMRKNVEPAETRRRATGLLLAIPALCVGGQFLGFAAGKPGEFGRFMLLMDLFLLVEGVVALATFIRNPTVRLVGGAMIVISTAIPGFCYLRGFLRDSRPTTSRLVAAEQLRSASVRQLAVFAEPSPYCAPPFNLFDAQIILMPPNPVANGMRAEITALKVTDGPENVGTFRRLWTWTPISWADKREDVDGDDPE